MDENWAQEYIQGLQSTMQQTIRANKPRKELIGKKFTAANAKQEVVGEVEVAGIDTEKPGLFYILRNTKTGEEHKCLGAIVNSIFDNEKSDFGARGE